MARRILVLGASPSQVPLIQAARQRGLWVATCDNVPANPGHRLADEHHAVSTVDIDAVVRLARGLHIDAVASISSDPAMVTVAEVAASLGLPGPDPASMTALTRKDLLRARMRELGLPTPSFRVYEAKDLRDGGRIADEAAALGPRCVVKPVDSSGSRGVAVIDARASGALPAMRAAIDGALGHSRCGRVIVESFVEGAQLHGDGLLRDGRLVFHYLGDHVLHERGAFVAPLWTRWPSTQPRAAIDEAARQVGLVAAACGYRDGPINIEARVRPGGEIVLIDLGPRNAGSSIPLLLRELTGLDFVQGVLDAALGIPASVRPRPEPWGAGVAYILRAERSGRFVRVEADADIVRHVVHLETWPQPGDAVQAYAGSHTALGFGLFSFPSAEACDRVMADIGRHLAIDIEPDRDR